MSTHQEIVQAALFARKAGLSLQVEGQPGIGKTAIGIELAQHWKIPYVIVGMAQTDSIEMQGALVVTECNGVRIADFLPMAKWVDATHQAFVIILDEYGQAPIALQNAASDLLLNKRVGSTSLHPDTFVIATSNRQSDRAGTSRRPSQIINRSLVMELSISSQDWIEWYLSTTPHPLVVGFLNFRQDLLNTFDPRQSDKPYASPRSWVMWSELLRSGLPKVLWLACASGLIGEAPALEFMAFSRLTDECQDPILLLKDPSAYKEPCDIGTLNATAMAIANAVKPEWVENFFELANDKFPAEISAVMVKVAASRDKSLTRGKGWSRWAATTGKYIRRLSHA